MVVTAHPAGNRPPLAKGKTWRAAMFAEEKPTLLPLPLELNVSLSNLE
jgi:hypothetical protein